MKKYLFMAIAAVAALAISSCKPNQEEPQKTDDITIKFDKKHLDLGLDDSERLTITVSPAGAQVQPKYASSDTNVATVSASGIITAVAEGEAQIIVTAEGAKGDTCSVTVSDMAVLASYGILDYGLFGDEPLSYVEGSDTVMEISFLNGQKYNCRIAYWPIYAWDGNLVFINGSGWSGKGFITMLNVPFYTIYDENAPTVKDPETGDDFSYNLCPFGWGSFRVIDTKGLAYRNTAEAGKVNEDVYLEYMDSYFTELINKGDGSNIKWDLLADAVTGSIVSIIDATGTEPELYYLDYGLVHGLVKDLILNYDGKTETFTYSADIDWFDFVTGNAYYGLAVQTVEGKDEIVKPYELRMISRHYGEEAEEAPAKHETMFIPKRYKEMPPMPTKARKVSVDKLYRK